MNIGLKIAIAVVSLMLNATALAQTKTRVIEIEISADARAVVGTQQRWLEMLQDVGADRVSSKTGSAKTPTIEETDLGATTLITITGSIHRNRLLLPGGSFAITDKSKISDLIETFRDDGAKVALAEKKAFGLTSEQLVDLHTILAKPLTENTRGETPSDVVNQISKLTGLKFKLDSAALTALRGTETVAEELKGISAGTALAVVVRPLGLVVQPQRLQGKSLDVLIVDSNQSTENWPIGWPIEKPPVQVEPKLFERLKLEIRGFPLRDAMDAIEKRTGVPFFYDHNGLAREGVELSEVRVTLVQDKASFAVAISKLLRQSKPKLQDEIRVDENGKPFLWISVQ